ncbi:PrkA family serine protein kinase [Candidatus Kaiserbacteria bacterium RIFCSPHIGHO2_02_FULL_49_34]|uniref:PrkA family serine protein kinase n=1 Tax=Candidatus Kaiserbacteria bacterium RIFCSPHIGHO2_02_FULL_49_34 TaxID=1798491 RepID=A0A1F6DKF2_9BACT|nr:MAG: PrkA family serine protein kinase [Candidatus Kaiserbacteria bacterium RIFCSPHIGHO2_02_FULL_49_34]
MATALKSRTSGRAPEEMSMDEYLALCKSDPMAYATAHERMVAAIGEPTLVDTSNDPRLSRIFSNKMIMMYPSFPEFHGMEDAIGQIASYYKRAAQGLEERKQILYLLGPVGGGKSSLAECMKSLFQSQPFYTIKIDDVISPLYESPLGLFGPESYEILEGEYGIPQHVASRHILSPWAVKRLREAGDDYQKFTVVKLYPSELMQIGISKTEPGDENNQDISALVGKVDIRQLEKFPQDDPDCYSYSGSLCRATQGLMEFVEMFKAPIKVLHPMLTASQEGNYKGTEGLGAMPFSGILLAHSNEAEWQTFRNNKNNEAFIDRIFIVKVPYCLRITDEIKIYEKLIKHSNLHRNVCAPNTLKMLAEFLIASRMKMPENTSLATKLKIYDGLDVRATDPDAKSVQELREHAGVDEGMTGLSTRWGYKVLSEVYNFDHMEIAANPVHLMYVLEDRVMKDQYSKEVSEQYLGFINDHLKPRFLEFIGKEIQTAYLESYSEYGQNIFERYFLYADHWIQENDYRDPETGEAFNKEALNKELEKIEKPAGVSNPKDFRNEVVNWILRAKSSHEGQMPAWTDFEKLRTVIEKKMFSNTEELLPVITATTKASKEDQKKHDDFVGRMMAKGYTAKQVKMLSEWYLRARKQS